MIRQSAFRYPVSRMPEIALVDELLLSRNCIAACLETFLKQRYRLLCFASITEMVAIEALQLKLVILVVHDQTENKTRKAVMAMAGSQVALLVVTSDGYASLENLPNLVGDSGVVGIVSTTDSGIGLLRAAVQFVLSGCTFVPPEFLGADKNSCYIRRECSSAIN